MFPFIVNPDAAAAVLAGVEDAAVRRRAEVDDLMGVLAWADPHRADPHDNGDLLPGEARPGGEVVFELGGEGTPGMRDLSLCELGIARGVHPLAVRTMMLMRWTYVGACRSSSTGSGLGGVRCGWPAGWPR